MGSYYTFSYINAEGDLTTFGVPFGTIRAYYDGEPGDYPSWMDFRYKITSPATDLFDFFAKLRGVALTVDTGGIASFSTISVASNLVDSTIVTIKTRVRNVLTGMYGTSNSASAFINAVLDECVDAAKNECVILTFNTAKITTPYEINVGSETQFVASNNFFNSLGRVLDKYQYDPPSDNVPARSPGNFGFNGFPYMMVGISFYKLTGTALSDISMQTPSGAAELDIGTMICATTSGNVLVVQCPPMDGGKFALSQLSVRNILADTGEDMVVLSKQDGGKIPFATPTVANVINLHFSVYGFTGGDSNSAFAMEMTFNGLSPLANTGESSYAQTYRVTQNARGNTTFFFLRTSSLKPIEPSENNPDDEPKPEGGDGDRDKGTTPIPHPSVPQIATGNMVHVYQVNTAALNALHDYVWSKDFFDNILKIITNPRDCLVSLYSLPVNYVGVSDTIQLGNIDTKIAATTVPQRYFQYSVVSTPMRVTKYYGTFLDYEPYTSIDLYLPYYGYYHLSCSQVYDVNITVNLVLDMYAGYGMYNIMYNGSVVAQVSANFSTQLPLSINDMTGATAGIIGGAITAFSGDVVSGIVDAATNYREQPLMVSDVGGGSGILSIRKVHIRRTIPTRSVSNNFPSMVGLKSTQGTLIGDIDSGYFKVLEVNLDSIPCTEEEKAMITNYLKSGVRF